jgi:hypothetical protein
MLLNIVYENIYLCLMAFFEVCKSIHEFQIIFFSSENLKGRDLGVYGRALLISI